MTASARGTVEEPGKNVAQKAGLNRSFLDVSPYETRLFLEYKMRRKGGTIIYVNPAYTSQRCSVCGHVDASNRPERDVFLLRLLRSHRLRGPQRRAEHPEFGA